MEPTIYKPSIYKGAGIYKDCGTIYNGSGVYKYGGGGGGLPTISVGGRDYQYVQIGNQFWINEDLQLETNGHTGYYNVSDYTNIKYSGLLPDGWRLATETDVNNLTSFLTSQGYNNISEVLRSVNDWNNPGLDLFGFNALPVGYQNPYGSPQDLGVSWLIRTDFSHYWLLDTDNPMHYWAGDNITRTFFMPVRLVKDV